MTTVVDLEIPADRLGLAQTFDRVPAFEFEIGGLIGDASPLVWLSGSDRRTIRRALETDPSVELLAALTERNRVGTDVDGGAVGERWLYRLAFGRRVERFQRLVSEHSGAILEATGRDGQWTVQLLFHDRVLVSSCHAALDRNEFEIEVSKVAETADLSSARTPLTDTQYETVRVAHELGYFDVPRQVTLAELADELEISHQALSERLRRSHAALVGAELQSTPPKIDP